MSRESLSRGCGWVVQACLIILILSTSTQLLPSFTVLNYLTEFRLVLLLALAAWAVRATLERNFHLRRTFLDWPILIVVGISGLSTAATGFGVSGPGFRSLLEVVLLYYIAVNNIRDISQLQAMVVTLALAMAFAAVAGIKQATGNLDTGFYLVSEAGKGLVPVESLQRPAEAVVRIRGDFGNPNLLGAYLMALIPIAASLATLPVSGSKRLLVWAVMALAMAAMILTYGRGAWFSLLAGIAVAAVLNAKWRKIILPLGGLSVVVVLALPGMLARLAHPLELFGRSDAWGAALGMMRDHPLTGVGFGQFLNQSLKYAPSQLWHAHNLFLNYGAETGMIGGLAFAGLFVWLLRGSVITTRTTQDPFLKVLACGLLAAVVAFSIHSLTDAVYNVWDLARLFWLISAMVVTVGRLEAPAIEEEQREKIMEPVTPLEPQPPAFEPG